VTDRNGPCRRCGHPRIGHYDTTGVYYDTTGVCHADDCTCPGTRIDALAPLTLPPTDQPGEQR